MTDKSKQPKSHDGVISSLDIAIGLVNIGKEASGMTPAPAVFGLVTILLTTIRDKMTNDQDCVDLGILCAEVCDALGRGTGGKKKEELSPRVHNAISRLETSIREIQRKINQQTRKNWLVKYPTASNVKGKIAGWKSGLDQILRVFNTELALNTNIVAADTHAVAVDIHTIVAAIHTATIGTHQAVMEMREAGPHGQNWVTESGVLQGELPPPPPKVFFGRDELVQKIVSSTENLTSMALIGTGGIGKTSVILTVLDDHRVKKRFGDNRSFIRCDRLNPSHTHLLQKLSEAIGAGVKNPEDLSPLRRCLSSKEMVIVLDNAESILGLAETSTREIHTIVDELSQFSNICLIITSRMSNALPPHCEIIDVPTLSMEAGQETFYRIHSLGERLGQVNHILRELDFHPLSITLLATVAQQNRWDTKRLTTEWEKRRTGVLRTRNLGSLADTIDLSLASPMFQELGPDAREVLGVVAFFPQGIDEDNVERLFPTISDVSSVFDTLCNLSLTYRSNGFITMLAPLRDYLCPKDPMASPLLRGAKEHYFRRLSVNGLNPGEPGFLESQWIVSEDVNVEHLLDIFIPIDADSEDIWKACVRFMDHLRRHKPRLVTLGSKFDALPDTHFFKPRCLLSLARLFRGVGNLGEQKRMLTRSLGIWRERGDDHWVAETLSSLSAANLQIGCNEGVQQAEEASKIYGQLGEKENQAACLLFIAMFLGLDKQFDEAEKAASHATNLLEGGSQQRLCQSHHVLGVINQARGNTKKAFYHFEASLQITSGLGCGNLRSASHLTLAQMYAYEEKFDDAQNHIEHAKSHVENDMVLLGLTLLSSAWVLHHQRKFKEAKSEALCALGISIKMGNDWGMPLACSVLAMIEKELNNETESK